VQKTLSRVKSHLVGRPQFAQPTEMPEFWRPSAAVRGDLPVSTLQRRRVWHDCSAHPTSWPESSPTQTANVHSLSDRNKEVGLQFCRHFQGIMPENPDLPNNHLMGDEAHFYMHGTANKQTFRDKSHANLHKLHHRPF